MRISLAFAAIAGGATLLRAQSDSLRPNRDTVRLSPTVVTVTRTPLELSRAPFAVGIAGRDEIQRGKPGFALDEVLVGIAGVQVDNRFNYALGERISIRGFGARAQFGVRGVRVILDGIPMTIADGQTTLNNVDAGDIARAEVMRGPASALHGNAAGGVIQLQSDLGDDSGSELRAESGADGLLRYQLASRHASRRQFAAVSASHLGYNGYRDWNTAKNDRVTFQVGRYFTLGDLALRGNWVAYDADNPGALPKDSARLHPQMAWPANKNTFLTGESGKQGQLGATWRQVLRGRELELSAHGLQRHVDNPIPQRIVVIDRNAGGARAAIAGTVARHARLSGGAELQTQRDDRRNYVNSGGNRGATALDQLERVLNTAVFAQATAEVGSRVLLMVGARGDRIRFRATDRLVSGTNPDDSGERTMSALSPSVGVTWSATSLLDVYSNYSTSFETPTTSELANQSSGAGGINQGLDPQRTASAELGVNGRVRLGAIVGSYQIATYRAEVRDALIPFEVPSAPGRQYFRNAGSTRHQGIETATSLVLPRHLALRASYTFTEARFVDYAVTTGTTTVRYDDKWVPGVAANHADATLSFQPRNYFVDFETRASSSIPVNDANTERSAAYVVHALRVGMRDVRAGTVTVAPHVGVLNLLDRAYNTSVVVNAFGGRYYEPGPPRSLYGGVRIGF